MAAGSGSAGCAKQAAPDPNPNPNPNPNQARIHAFAAEAGLAPSRSWSDDTYLLVELRPPAATE